MLLLPFLENAFKHGASESRFDSFIQLDMKLRDGLLKFNIVNSKENRTNHSTDDSIGLSNVKRQLELIYKEYEMQVMDEPSTFTVSLNVNLNNHAKI